MPESKLIVDLNEHLRKLVDDGCFDLANNFYDVLEEHDLLLDEDEVEDRYVADND